MTTLTRPPAPAYARLTATLLAAGFGDSNMQKAHKRHRRTVGAFFVPAVHRYGGCVWEAARSAGFLLPRFANLHTVTTLNRLATIRGDSKAKGVSQMSNTAQGASAPSLLSRHIAAAHRRMALAALRADSSISVRLHRYNAHMSKARALVGDAA
jgi:hypothetical protein